MTQFFKTEKTVLTYLLSWFVLMRHYVVRRGETMGVNVTVWGFYSSLCPCHVAR